MREQSTLTSDGRFTKFLDSHKEPMLLFLISRIVFFAIILVSGTSYRDLLYGFDGEHYIRIAREGYDIDALKAFFPMVPLLIRFIGVYGTAVVNNICFMVSLCLMGSITGRHENRTLILTLLALSPISFFGMLIYTESIFLLLTLGAYILYTKRKYPLLMGILIGLSVFTRSTGSIVFFAVFIGMCVDWRRKISTFADILKAYIPATLISLIFPVFLQVRYGNWKYFIDVQEPCWSKVSSSFLKTLLIEFKVLFTDTYKYDGLDFTFLNKLNEVYTLGITIVFIFLIVFEIRKRKGADIVSAAVLILTLFIISSTIRNPEYDAPTVSFFRYYLVMFPAYTLLRDKNEKAVMVITAASVLMSLFATYLFSKGVYFF